jgi:arginine/ornithine N-succinyltransferase beta subunit
MLKKIGFKYKNQVDPFDGGPHLWVDVEDMLPVKKQVTRNYQPALAADSSLVQESGLICRAKPHPGEFRAMAVQAVTNQDGVAVLGLGDADRARLEKVLGLSAGEPAVFMPYY